MKKWILVPLLLGVFIAGLVNLSKHEEVESLITEVHRELDVVNGLLNDVDVAYKILNSTVYIAAYSGNTMLWQGSGTLISYDGLILTAAHVVKPSGFSVPNKFKVELLDGTEYWSHDWKYRNDVDLGFIQLDSNDVFTFIDIFDTTVDYIDEVYICGNPYGYECRHNITKGIISGLNRDFEGFFGDYYMIQADAQSQPGNSGGGVFNMQGEIVGVLVGGYQGVDGMSLIIPSEVIVKVLECYNDEMVLEDMKIRR